MMKISERLKASRAIVEIADAAATTTIERQKGRAALLTTILLRVRFSLKQSTLIGCFEILPFSIGCSAAADLK